MTSIKGKRNYQLYEPHTTDYSMFRCRIILSNSYITLKVAYVSGRHNSDIQLTCKSKVNISKPVGLPIIKPTLIGFNQNHLKSQVSESLAGLAWHSVLFLIHSFTLHSFLNHLSSALLPVEKWFKRQYSASSTQLLPPLTIIFFRFPARRTCSILQMSWRRETTCWRRSKERRKRKRRQS